MCSIFIRSSVVLLCIVSGFPSSILASPTLKRDVKANFVDPKCSAIDKIVVREGFSEVAKMADNLATKSQLLIDWLTENIVNKPGIQDLPKFDDIDIYTIFITFETFVGRMMWPKDEDSGITGNWKRNFNGDSTKYIERVRDIGQALAKNINDQATKLDIYCQDDWLENTKRDGTESEQPKRLYWDARVESIQDNERSWIDVGGDSEDGGGSCRDSDKLEAQVFQHGYGIGGTTDVLMICPRTFSTWAEAGAASLQDFVDEVVPQTTLDHLKRYIPSVLLFHELSHSREMMKGGPLAYSQDIDVQGYKKDASKVDNSGTIMFDFEDFSVDAPYEYAGVSLVALGPMPYGDHLERRLENQDLASKNAETLAYLATALYLDKNIWTANHPEKPPSLQALQGE